MRPENLENLTPRENRRAGAILGLATGDALGATHEFSSPEEVLEGPLEIVGGGWLRLEPGETTDDTFAKLNGEFADRDAVVLGGSTDNEFSKLAWRRSHDDLDKLDQWSFADTTGSLVDQLGVRSDEGVALRATFIVDPHNVIQHVAVNNLNVGRNPEETLRVLDGLQTDELCACNRPLAGSTL